MICYRHEWGRAVNYIFEDGPVKTVVRRQHCQSCRAHQDLPACNHQWKYDGAVHLDSHTISYRRCITCGVRLHSTTSYVLPELPSKLEQAIEKSFCPDDYIFVREEEDEDDNDWL